MISRLATGVVLAVLTALPVEGAVVKGVVIADQLGGPGMDNVPISIDEAAANSTVSKDGGQFAFAFPDKQPGEIVHVRVNKEGYVVVNDVQLEVTIPANPDAKLVSLILCKAEIREEMARLFYRLKSSEAVEATYQQKLKALKEEHRADAAAFAAEKARLQQERDQAKATADKVSEELAKNRPGQNTELYQQAKRLFVEGKVEEAITLLKDEEKLRQLDEQAKKAIENAVQPRLLRAQLLSLKLRFEEAEKAYLQAIEIAPDSFEANFAYAALNQVLNRFEKGKDCLRALLGMGKEEWQKCRAGADAQLAGDSRRQAEPDGESPEGI
jgi:tetratricopeptide (TPR) repeat protein